jgi:hypothetical protein
MSQQIKTNQSQRSSDINCSQQLSDISLNRSRKPLKRLQEARGLKKEQRAELPRVAGTQRDKQSEIRPRQHSKPTPLNVIKHSFIGAQEVAKIKREKRNKLLQKDVQGMQRNHHKDIASRTSLEQEATQQAIRNLEHSLKPQGKETRQHAPQQVSRTAAIAHVQATQASGQTVYTYWKKKEGFIFFTNNPDKVKEVFGEKAVTLKMREFIGDIQRIDVHEGLHKVDKLKLECVDQVDDSYDADEHIYDAHPVEYAARHMPMSPPAINVPIAAAEHTPNTHPVQRGEINPATAHVQQHMQGYAAPLVPLAEPAIYTPVPVPSTVQYAYLHRLTETVEGNQAAEIAYQVYQDRTRMMQQRGEGEIAIAPHEPAFPPHIPDAYPVQRSEINSPTEHVEPGMPRHAAQHEPVVTNGFQALGFSDAQHAYFQAPRLEEWDHVEYKNIQYYIVLNTIMQALTYISIYNDYQRMLAFERYNDYYQIVHNQDDIFGNNLLEDGVTEHEESGIFSETKEKEENKHFLENYQKDVNESEDVIDDAKINIDEVEAEKNLTNGQLEIAMIEHAYAEDAESLQEGWAEEYNQLLAEHGYQKALVDGFYIRCAEERQALDAKYRVISHSDTRTAIEAY